MGQIRPLLLYFQPFLNTMTNIVQNVTIKAQVCLGLKPLNCRRIRIHWAVATPPSTTLLHSRRYIGSQWLWCLCDKNLTFSVNCLGRGIIRTFVNVKSVQKVSNSILKEKYTFKNRIFMLICFLLSFNNIKSKIYLVCEYRRTLSKIKPLY